MVYLCTAVRHLHNDFTEYVTAVLVVVAVLEGEESTWHQAAADGLRGTGSLFTKSSCISRNRSEGTTLLGRQPMITL
jgi:hypothetical protein